MNNKLIVAGAVLILGLGTWAVFSALESEPGPPGPLAIYAGPWNQDDAPVGGVLVLDGPCVYVESGGSRTFVTFAAGGTWWVDGDPPGIRLPAGTFRIGDEVRWGGGFASAGSPDWRDSQWEWEVPPDPGCDVGNWWKVSHGGR